MIKESPPFNEKETQHLKENHKRIVNYGRKPDLKIYFENDEVFVSDLASNLLQEMYEIAEELGKILFREKNNGDFSIGKTKEFCPIKIRTKLEIGKLFNSKIISYDNNMLVA